MIGTDQKSYGVRHEQPHETDSPATDTTTAVSNDAITSSSNLVRRTSTPTDCALSSPMANALSWRDCVNRIAAQTVITAAGTPRSDQLAPLTEPSNQKSTPES